MKKLSIILLLITASLCQRANSQDFKVTKSAYENKDYLHEFLQLNNQKIVCLEYASPHNAFSPKRSYKHSNVIILDNNLKVLKENEPEVLTKKTYAACYVANEQAYLCYQDNNNKVGLYQLNSSDGTVVLKKELFETPNDFNTYFGGTSPNKKFNFLLCKSYKKYENGIYHVVIFDDQMNVIKQIECRGQFYRYGIDNTICKINNNGIVGIFGYGSKPNEKDYIEIGTIRENGASKIVTIPSTPEYFTAAPGCVMDDNKLTLIGTQPPQKGRKNINTLSVQQFDLSTNKLGEIKNVPLETTISSGGTITNTWIADNGSIYLYYDLLNAYDKSTITPSGKEFSTGVNFMSGNGYAIKLSTDYKVEWQRTIAKNQIETQELFFSGTVCTVDKDENMFLFYTDQLKNISTSADEGVLPSRIFIRGAMPDCGLACVKITKDGKTEKKFITKNESEPHHLAISAYNDAIPNRLIFTAFEMKSWANGTYKIGKIEWKKQ